MSKRKERPLRVTDGLRKEAGRRDAERVRAHKTARNGKPVQVQVVEPGTLMRRIPKFTQTELEKAFAKVKPHKHWKDPIYAIIDAADMDVVDAAIIHFTATKADFRMIKTGKLTVRADGYAAGPAGDR
ncbi:hypothetical protein LCGC14_0427430 [marine sediment metagenome]|uniref:Uncharacterized protein n=1 Tax=marine sediment metagenome TaxID=412755 RepID=A0A0F9VYE1_9ZZZZ